MSILNTLREAAAKRARYNETVRELRALPVELAVEDLGIHPSDAERIARQTVYGS